MRAKPLSKQQEEKQRYHNRMLEINEEFEKYWKEVMDGATREDKFGLREIARDAWFFCQGKNDVEKELQRIEELERVRQ